jgi:hypothetical protein
MSDVKSIAGIYPKPCPKEIFRIRNDWLPFEMPESVIINSGRDKKEEGMDGENNLRLDTQY